MPRRLGPLDILTLGRWIAAERRDRGSIFGIDPSLFVSPADTAGLETERFGRLLEAPLGVAAGPHTQLAGNIVSAWLCGARLIELKTVQALGAVEVAKPCIDVEDEGYNCEWSQELTLDEAYDQYLNAWVLIHLLRRELFGDSLPHEGRPVAGRTRGGGEPGRGARARGMSDSGPGSGPRGPDPKGAGPRGSGVIFNISVGYDLAGIRSAPMRRFVERMRDSGEEIERRLELLRPLYPAAGGLEVPAEISNSVTLSTMHGCPPEEVERIGRYLIEEAGLHTQVKLNPTLLGPEAVRELLIERLGYRVIVPDSAFAHDLAYPEAVEVAGRLKESAERRGLSFAVKLANTLECLTDRQTLGAGGEPLYLSGRALYPLTTALAARLASDLDLDLSYAGGADALNFPRLVAAGVWPVTVCSDLLRPGGYGRLRHYLGGLKSLMEQAGAATIEELSGKGAQRSGALPERLRELAAEAAASGRYAKSAYPPRSIKNARELPLFDCIAAPCIAACPLGQQVPAYLRAAAHGDAGEALRIIREDNPVASLCAMVCDHPCELACVRLATDEPLAIRDLKRWAVERGGEPPIAPSRAAAAGVCVAVVGAGPAGLACAWELAREGAEVTLYEAESKAGGMATRAIPRYRLDAADIERDVARLRAAGVRLLLSRALSAAQARAMIGHDCDFLFYAGGAPLDAALGIPGEGSPRVAGALAFLQELKASGGFAALGPSREGRPVEILVVGGGNAAMDAARSARRLTGPSGRVRLLYRRTIEQMPADREELEALRTEGVELLELTQPVVIEGRGGGLAVRCIRTRLGEPDATGRPRSLPVAGSEHLLTADLLVTAVGQRLDEAGRDLCRGGGTEARILSGGDAARGPSTIVQAAADGRAAARAILAAAGKSSGGGSVARKRASERPGAREPAARAGNLLAGRALRAAGLTARARPAELPLERRGLADRVIGSLSDAEASAEASRCLACDLACDICVGVCPNRANLSYRTHPHGYPLYRFSGKGGAASFERCGDFTIRQERQVLTVSELCNECGNCATFCPSSGAPYRRKPLLCLTEEGFREAESALYLPPSFPASIMQRSQGRLSRLELRDDDAVWRTEGWEAVFSVDTMELRELALTGEGEVGGTSEEAVRLAVFLDGLRNCPLPSAGAGGIS